MFSVYTRDLSLEVAYKLESTSINELSKVSKQWSFLLTNEVWMLRFIRTFGADLLPKADYNREYLLMEKLKLQDLYYYVVRNGYNKVYLNMSIKWKVPKSLIVIATHYGNLEILKLLLAKGANVHTQEDLLLRLAASKGHVDIVKFLLANGASIHAQGDKALEWAIEGGNLEVINLLLANMNTVKER